MKKFILWKQEHGWCIVNFYDDGDTYLTFTDDVTKATELPFGKISLYLTRDIYVFESPMYQDMQ